jgi:hypothetical protein
MPGRIHVRRSTRRWSRRTRVALAGIAVLLAVAVPVAWANHQFADVPTTSPHHDDISAIANAGITTGCNPPTNTLYCPDIAVRRDQMASFMRRGLGRAAYSEYNAVVPPTYDTAVGLISITPGLPAGALAGAAGFVTATVHGTVFLADATGCPCTFFADLWHPESDWLTGFPSAISVNQPGFHQISTTGVGRFTTPGQKDIGIYVVRVEGTAEAQVFGTASAQYLPFGPGGGNTLGEGAPSAAPRGDVPIPQRPGTPSG